MLTRTLKRALLDPRYGQPPTFLLPWSAGLTTTSAPIASSASTFPPVTPAHDHRPQLHSRTIKEQQSSTTPAASEERLQLSDSVRDLLPALRAQGQNYIQIHIYGKQYLLTQGDVLRLPFLMQDVEIGDTLRLNRAALLGSRDFTLKPSAAATKIRSSMTVNMTSHGDEMDNATSNRTPAISPSGKVVRAPHYIPHIAKGQYSYLDERLYVCRATVVGVESEPLRIKEKTKQRQRHVKHVKSKHRFTILKIKEVRARSLDEIDNGEVD